MSLKSIKFYFLLLLSSTVFGLSSLKAQDVAETSVEDTTQFSGQNSDSFNVGEAEYDDDYADDNSFKISLVDTLDTSKFSRTEISKDKFQQLAKEGDYTYQKEKTDKPQTASGNSFWYRFIEAIIQFIGSGIGNLILWFLLIALVAWFIYYWISERGMSLFARKNKKVAAGEEDELSDELLINNWENVIEKAEQNGDYRMALRYGYRHLLVLFQEKGLLKVDTSASNFHYLNELNGTPYYAAFRVLLRQYEYVWYGEYPINESNYQKPKAIYLSLKSKLTTS